MGLARTIGGAAVGLILAPATGGMSVIASMAAGAAVSNIAGAINDDDLKEKARKEGFKDGYQKCSTDDIDKLCKYAAEHK
jgi:outer membrane lipoprotein SlyB